MTASAEEDEMLTAPGQPPTGPGTNAQTGPHATGADAEDPDEDWAEV